MPSGPDIATDEIFRILSQNIPGTVYLCRNNPRYDMLFLSDRIESLVGIAAAEFLADRVSLADLFHPDDAQAVHQGVAAGVAHRQPFHLEYRLRHAAGHWVWVEEYGVGVHDAAGELKFLEGAIFDISSRRRLEDERRVAFEEIARLKDALERERNYLRQEVADALQAGAIVGQSPQLRQVLEQLQAVAATPANVLILGESGVGKELVAREIHARSPRHGRPLVKVNCGGIHPNLFESEFFGHVKGSFSGAFRDHVGRFELADGGTLFLDEVGEIPPELQSKLLRVLQERQFERVGDTTVRTVDVRVIAATNRDLEAEVRRGRFREDLFYRLSVFPIHVPPLRARRDDILPLAQHCLERMCRQLDRPPLAFTADDERQLLEYPWPGNVRELQNVIERAVILSAAGVLRLSVALATPVRPPATVSLGVAQDVPASQRPQTAEQLAAGQRENLLAALSRAHWRVEGEGGAAELLGMKPGRVRYQMQKFGLRRPERTEEGRSHG